MTDRSELVVSGQITRSWADWDASHHFIWTHYELAISSVYKGQASSTVEFSEPGGVVGSIQQTIAGTVQYQAGEKVFVFLERMPNGYLRTTGWAQGKFSIDSAGRVHPAALSGLDMIDLKAAPATATLPIDGIAVTAMAARVTARIRAQQASPAGRIQ